MIWNIISGKPHILTDEELKWLNDRKKEAIINGDEDRANDIWRIEIIANIWKMYIGAFEYLKKKEKHESAWNLFAQIEIVISLLRRHFDVNNKYKLLFIESATREFQKLFPYKFFISRESIIKETTCSICGKVRTLRNPCGHIKGELYNGEMCYRTITGFKLITISLVTNPVDKYAVVHLNGQEYSYRLLDTFVDSLYDPFDEWKVDVIKIKNPKFKKVGSNTPCPCGSGIKYKKCCLKNGNDMIDHYEFSLPRNKIGPKLIGNRFLLN